MSNVCGNTNCTKNELRIQLHLLNISLMGNFIFCAVKKPYVKKIFRKEIIKRSNLKNIANKLGKIKYKKRKGCKKRS